MASPCFSPAGRPLSGVRTPSSNHAGLRTAARMQAVQSPIIPIVAQLIRDHPGTLSLGQGVVSYGPPPEVYGALERGMGDPENHKYRPVTGVPELVDAFRRKLAIENNVRSQDHSSILVTAGSNLGFYECDPRDR